MAILQTKEYEVTTRGTRGEQVESEPAVSPPPDIRPETEASVSLDNSVYQLPEPTQNSTDAANKPTDNIIIPNQSDFSVVKIYDSSKKEELAITFRPYDFKFNDSYKPEFNNYDPFGRMDPVMIYKRTTRDVTLSFKVVAERQQDAEENFLKLQKLITFMYPTYSLNKETATPGQAARMIQEGKTSMNVSDAGIMTSSPLLFIKFMNLLDDNSYALAPTNFKYDLDFENGSFTSANVNGNKKAFPGRISFDFSFKVLHTYLPGTRYAYGG